MRRGDARLDATLTDMCGDRKISPTNMAVKTGVSISVKLIVTSTLLTLLVVLAFGFTSVLNVRDECARDLERIVETFHDRQRTDGQALSDVARVLFLDLPGLPPAPAIVPTLVRRPGVTFVYVLSRDRRVRFACWFARDGTGCEPARARVPDAASPSATPSPAWWTAIDNALRERISPSERKALIELERDIDGHTVLLQARIVRRGQKNSSTNSEPLRSSAGESAPVLGYVILGFDPQPLRDALYDRRARASIAERALLLRIVTIGALFALIGGVLAFIQGIRLSKPLKLLAWRADRLARGSTLEPVPVSATDELGVLGAAFNRLASTIDRAREQVAYDKDLAIARAIQEHLVPPNDPIDFGTYTVAGYFQPSSPYGGDFWTCHRLTDGQVLLLIGDATTTGVDAALIAAASKVASEIHYAGAFDADTDEPARADVSTLLAAMNSAVYQTTKGDMAMTCFAAILDLETRIISYANAGHPFPYLYRVGDSGDGEFGSLMLRGNRLGELKESRYQSKSTQLRPGDTLVFYTDGIVECRDENHARYGEERFRTSIRKAAHLAPGDLRSTVVADAMAFYGKELRTDDITMIVGRVS